MGSSRAYEPSSFLRIRYTMNITTSMAHRRPTTAPPMTAETKQNHSNQTLRSKQEKRLTCQDAGLCEEGSRSVLVLRIHDDVVERRLAVVYWHNLRGDVHVNNPRRWRRRESIIHGDERVFYKLSNLIKCRGWRKRNTDVSSGDPHRLVLRRTRCILSRGSHPCPLGHYPLYCLYRSNRRTPHCSAGKTERTHSRCMRN